MNTDRQNQSDRGQSNEGVKLVPRLVSRRSLASFTLIELLVVVAIILILAGMSLKIMSMVTRKTATARTIMVLEQVKGALGAYYATYGSYPPVNTVYSSAPYKMPSTPPPDPKTSRGLTSYIMSCYSKYSGSPDTLAFFNQEARRWDYYWEKIGDRAYYTSPTNKMGAAGSMYFWTNAAVTILDGWDREIRYSPITTNNQEGYLLWSRGADGVSGNSDDIVVTFD